MTNLQFIKKQLRQLHPKDKSRVIVVATEEDIPATRRPGDVVIIIGEKFRNV